MAAAGDVFAVFIEGELKVERERRTALDARGVGVVTTSGALVTLLLALAAVATGVEDFAPDRPTAGLLIGGLVGFSAAALFGLFANRLKEYDVVLTRQLLEWRESDAVWSDSGAKAVRVLALANTRTLDSLRRGNDSKATWVERALWAQVVAVACVGAAMVVTLVDAL